MTEKQHPLLRKQQLLQAIQKNPHDRQAREQLAQWYDEQGRREEGSRERRKARQCEWFNPEFPYAKHLPAGLTCELLAEGEILILRDEVYFFYAEPAELQAYLKDKTPEEVDVAAMPLYDHEPPQEMLERLWKETPGKRYKPPAAWEETAGVLKSLEGGSWLYWAKEAEEYVFFSPAKSKIYGISDSALEVVAE